MTTSPSFLIQRETSIVISCLPRVTTKLLGEKVSSYRKKCFLRNILFARRKGHYIENGSFASFENAYSIFKVYAQTPMFSLPFIQRETPFVTSCLLPWTTKPLQKGVCSKLKKKFSQGANPLHFLRAPLKREVKTKMAELVPLKCTHSP